MVKKQSKSNLKKKMLVLFQNYLEVAERLRKNMRDADMEQCVGKRKQAMRKKIFKRNTFHFNILLSAGKEKMDLAVEQIQNSMEHKYVMNEQKNHY